MSELSTSPSFLTPKAALSVKGEIAPSVSLTFAKKLQDTKFSFTVTDQTLRQPSEFTGYVVSATRTDGALARLRVAPAPTHAIAAMHSCRALSARSEVTLRRVFIATRSIGLPISALRLSDEPASRSLRHVGAQS